MTVEVIWGAGILCALMIYWAYQLDNSTQSQWMRFILIGFILLNMLFIPKAVIDEKTVYFPVVNRSIDTDPSTTEFIYGTHAIEDTSSTTNQFYKTNQRFVWIMAMAILVWFIMFVIDMWKQGSKLR